ncbi:RNA 2',3'-cyclic phosphodiesterase [Candidatus Woesearchaeota archaeon]|nr:RNA 2',3'-cyclic phosphodiesterase [Candidatus Woesearchaeota archaeon]
MRLFIALDFDDPVYFQDIQKQMPSDTAKLTLTKTFHLTLKFLGEVHDNKVSELKERLKQVKFEPISAATDKIGVFPDENYIRVVWVGLKDGNKVIELQQSIEKALEGLFPRDNRFHPHITLARVKFVKEKAVFIKKIKDIRLESKEFLINSFKLVKSTLTPEGPVYEDLASFS